MRSFLQSMITDLEEDLISFNKTRRILNKEINNGSRILNFKNYATLPIDSISKLIGPFTYRYEGVNQTFEKITNSSLAGQLGSKSLTEAINGYYTVSLPSYVFFQRLINERTARDIEFWFENEDYEIAVPYSMDTSKKFPFQEDESIRKVKLLKHIGSNKGRNSLRTNVIGKSTILKELENYMKRQKH